MKDKELTVDRVNINLAKLNGNANVIIAAWSIEAKKQGFDEYHIDQVIKDAKSSDYTHLMNTIIENSIHQD